MVEAFVDMDARHAHDLSTPSRGSLFSVEVMHSSGRLPRHLWRPGKRPGMACFSLSHRHCLAGPASQPPAPNKLSTGGWDVKQWRWDREKQKEENRKEQKNQKHEEREAEVEPVVQVTRRDDAMLGWLAVVKMADMEAIRWALAGIEEGVADRPISLRKAQHWVSRMQQAGHVDRARPSYKEGQVVWATHQAIGKQAPNVYRQTTRHELAVAMVSARYISRGYTWSRDRRPESLQDHQVDGIAIKGDTVELIEVELTPKELRRYKFIHTHHAERMSRGGVSRVVYLCTKDAARAVSREADKFIFRTDRHRLVTLPVFDVRGKWIGNDTDLWDGVLDPVSSTGEIPTPELWNSTVLS